VLILKCTKKVQDYLKLKSDDLVEPVEREEGFGTWYVNQFQVDRRKCLIFMNEKTLKWYRKTGQVVKLCYGHHRGS
jgi:hypothetical protein